MFGLCCGLMSEKLKHLQLIQIMQSEHSSSLKSGSTKNKHSQKMGINAQLSKKGFSRLKAPISGTKTSQSDMDGHVVVVDGKVKTPKELITKKYKEYTEEYLKLLESQQEEQRKSKEQNEVKAKSSLNSQNDSEMKGSSSMNQEKSFMSSSKSQIDSETDLKREKKDNLKKDSRELTMQDLQKNVNILLEETPTIFTFYLPSTSYKLENEEIRKKNKEYEEYKQKLIGSDNFIARPVQTFNFQHKKIAETVERNVSVEMGVFASAWDIEDTLKLEKKSEYEVLSEDIKKNVDKEFNNFLMNPFSCLPLDKEAIDIHSKYEVPGAAEYLLKEKDFDKKGRSKKTGNSQAASGMAQVSTANVNKQPEASKAESSSKRQQSSQHSNKRNAKNTQLQIQIKQEQQKIEEEEKSFLNTLMKKAKQLPSQQQRRLMANENLQKMLKYIDRILNSQTFHKEYIAYRNYPEIEFVKKTAEDEIRNFSKKKKDEKKEEVKEPLQYLFTFSSKEFQNYSVTSADWNPVNKDLLAVAYELADRGESTDKTAKKGLLMFWTLKNPAFPQKIFYSQSRITACKFSIENPNLIACGTHDGVILIYDIRKKDNAPIAENKESLDKHTNTVWDIQWISKGKGNKGQSLVSISADGRITEWSMKKGLQFTDLMLLRRIPQSNKKDTTENMNFRFASGLSFEFLKGESSMYLATTEQGVIYRCSKSYTQQYLQIYSGHNGPIYKVRANPFLYDIFLTCSSDWSCKLWNWRRDTPLNSFQSLDIYDEVIDIEWSPNESTVFASVCKDGRLELWDLQKKNMLDPICTVKERNKKRLSPKTMVRFCKGDPVLVTGDINGQIDVYRLNRDEINLEFNDQRDRVSKLLYPNGYLMSTPTEQSSQQEGSMKTE